MGLTKIPRSGSEGGKSGLGVTIAVDPAISEGPVPTDIVERVGVAIGLKS
jgi:hypothetical protein